MNRTGNPIELVTLSEFGRRLQRSTVTVGDWIARGRIVAKLVGNKKLINWYSESERVVRSSRHPEHEKAIIDEWNKAHPLKKNRVTMESLAAEQGNDPGDLQLNSSISFATQNKTYYQAQLSRIEYEEKLGRLIEIAAVAKVLEGISLRTQKALMSIPDRTSSILAAEDDPANIRNILNTEIRIILENLASELNRLKSQIRIKSDTVIGANED